jgi:hypothetical protein
MKYIIIMTLILSACGDEPVDKFDESVETKADVLNAEASAFCHLCNYRTDVCDRFTYFVGGDTPREVEANHEGLEYRQKRICTEAQSYSGLTPP